MEQKILLIDQDGPLAQFEEAIFSELTENHPHVPAVPVTERKVFKIETEYDTAHHQLLWDIMNAENFFLNLTPVPGSIETVHRLAEIYNVFFCTSPLSANPYCASEKIRWIEKHIGPEYAKRVIITKDKTLIRGDYLIDDKAEIEGSITPSWQHIVFETPINRHITDQRLRAKWEHIETYLLTADTCSTTNVR